jgi:hypothetical protein
MSGTLELVAIIAGNLCGVAIVWCRVWATVKSRSLREAARCDVVRALGEGSRVVDLDGVGVMIEVGSGQRRVASLEGNADVDRGLDKPRRV